eukprot:10469788-Ditylum_brightwellii.AAC.2
MKRLTKGCQNLIVSKNLMQILNLLKKLNIPYDFKGVGIPEYYLGGDADVKHICEKVKLLLGWKLKGYMDPMDPNFHAKIESSNFLTGEDISKYRMMVRSLNWLVTLGLCDIYYAFCALARHMMMPRQGHDWFPLYGASREEELFGMPEPRGKLV